MNLSIEEKTENIKNYFIKLFPGSAPFVSASYYLHNVPKLEFSVSIYLNGHYVEFYEEETTCKSYGELMNFKPPHK